MEGGRIEEVDHGPYSVVLDYCPLSEVNTVTLYATSFTLELRIKCPSALPVSATYSLFSSFCSSSKSCSPQSRRHNFKLRPPWLIVQLQRSKRSASQSFSPHQAISPMCASCLRSRFPHPFDTPKAPFSILQKMPRLPRQGSESHQYRFYRRDEWR